jgi:hypothetical protein
MEGMFKVIYETLRDYSMLPFMLCVLNKLYGRNSSIDAQIIRAVCFSVDVLTFTTQPLTSDFLCSVPVHTVFE